MSAATTTPPARVSAPPTPGGGAHPLAGVGTLVRLILRRDRIRIPVWVLAIGGGLVLTTPFMEETFPTNEDIALRDQLISGNPAAVMLTGPGYGMSDASVDNYGPLIVNELGATAIILVTLMSLLLVVRYTRAEEESGRTELVRAGTVGRSAPLTAALIVVTAMNLVLGTLIAVGHIWLDDLGPLMGLGDLALDYPPEGAWAWGVGLALLGIVIAALAAVCAQVTESGRAAAGLSGLVFGALFLVRAIGDIQDSDLRWASPVGWAQGMRPFAGEQWWPAGYLAALALLLVIAAYLLNARRDLGAALLRPRLGRPRATRLLGSSLALAARLQWTTILVWAMVIIAIGAGMGSVLVGEAETIAGLDIFQQLMGASDSDDLAMQILGFYLLFLALTAGVLGLQVVLRARTEEAAGRAEPVLAAAVPRWRWAGGHLLLALGSTAAVIGVTGLGMGFGAAGSSGDSEDVWRLTEAALAYIPALAVLIGLAFALFGLLPRAAGLAWVALAYVALLATFGPLFDLPDWAYEVSPFHHVPDAATEELTAEPLLWLSGVALALLAAGFLGLWRRDMQSN